MVSDILDAVYVRARKSPWIETHVRTPTDASGESGLVRARGLKHTAYHKVTSGAVRARKSPWIETLGSNTDGKHPQSGLVRARGLKH